MSSIPSIPSSSVSPRIMLTPPMPPKPTALTKEKGLSEEGKKYDEFSQRVVLMAMGASFIASNYSHLRGEKTSGDKFTIPFNIIGSGIIGLSIFAKFKLVK